jgi:hypothetical protein
MRFALGGVLACASLAACTTPKHSEPQRDTRASARPVQPAPADDGTARATDDARYIKATVDTIDRLEAKGIHDMEARREAPFVVFADGGEPALERGAGTVRWAVDRLEADFFTNRPSTILPVFLFKDANSYYRGVEKLTGEEPSTPYGFYSRAHGGLFMNIATGGGTLVHEIVHPFVEADFPSAPAWLNEGLGSLFEQSAERDGHIVGLTNWRLAGLQKALKSDRVPSFQTLTHLGDNEFYGDDSGINYAAARYLLFYLQEKGVLRDFYRAFRAAKADDPSGYQTLVATLAVIGERDMTAFEASWKKYVAALTFP